MSSNDSNTVSTTTTTTTSLPAGSVIANDSISSGNGSSSSSSSSPGLLHRMVDAVKSHLPSLPHSSEVSHSSGSYEIPTSATSKTVSFERPDGAVWSKVVSTEPTSTIPIGSYPPSPDNAPSATPTSEYSLPSHPSKLSEKVEEGVEGMKERAHEVKEKARDQFEALRMEAGEIRREAGEKAGGLMDTLKEKLHNFHPFSSSDSTNTTTTTTTTTTIPQSTSNTFSSTPRQSDAGLSDKEKEEMDKFPTKYDRQGDLETFKKQVHSAYERGLGLDAVRDDRHYTREFPNSNSADSSSTTAETTKTTTTTTTTTPPSSSSSSFSSSSSASSSSPSISSSLEHVSTVPLASSTPFPDDVPTADPNFDFPSKSEVSEKVEALGEKADERLEAMKEKTGEKAGGLMENLKEDFRYAKEKLHEAGDHIRHPRNTSKEDSIEHTTTIASTGTETGMGPGPI